MVALGEQDYTGPGPLPVASSLVKLRLPPTRNAYLYSCRRQGEETLTLSVTITAPASSSPALPAPYPVLLLFNGFQTLAASYKPYAQRVASYGYVVVQYDIKGLLPIPGLLPMVHVRIELGFLGPLLQLLSDKAMTLHDPLFAMVDTTRLAAMGHSRGGKLAALHLAGSPGVSAACLLDPVDGDDSMAETDDNPSALRALAGAGKAAAVIGAGVLGQCAPTNYNYARFSEALSPGSWTQVIKEAGHTQVVDLSGPAAWIADKLCGKGSITREHAIAIAMPTCVAWLEKTFRPELDEAKQLEAYFSWVNATVGAGDITFVVKEDDKAASGDLQKRAHVTAVGLSTPAQGQLVTF